MPKKYRKNVKKGVLIRKKASFRYFLQSSLYYRRCFFLDFLKQIMNFFLSLPATSDVEPRDPCYPSPCGLNSQCVVSVDNKPSCSCIQNYVGSPPNCEPECRANSECPTNQACIRQKCTDPCIGLCGFNALCQVTLHLAQCTCPESYTGDPFTVCSQIICKKIPAILGYRPLINIISAF